MNIKTWALENKTVASLAGAFILGVAALGYLAWSSWNDYSAAQDDYNSKASELDRLSHKVPFPNESNLEKLGDTLEKNQKRLSKLTLAVQKFRVPSFGDIDKTKPQDQPQKFQDTLRGQVTAIKSLAASSGSTLPSSFYLGLDEYENQLPKPEQIPNLSQQLTALSWIAQTIAGQKGLVVSEFSLFHPDALTAKSSSSLPPPRDLALNPSGASSSAYQTVGLANITLRCDQLAFHQIINSISAAPYLLIMEEMKIQNSVPEPPKKDSPDSPQTGDAPSADGTTAVQRLPVIVGRESLNVSFKIRILDFPASQSKPEGSK